MDSQSQKNMDIKHKFLVKELIFVNKEKNGNNFKVKPNFSRKINKISDSQYEVSLKCEILDTAENPFPFDIVATISLVTTFGDDAKLTGDDLEKYLNITCLQLLFPFLRSAITNLTTNGMVNPLILPIIDVNHFSESLENKKRGDEENGGEKN